MHYTTLQLLCNSVFGSNTSFPNSKDIGGSFVSNDYAWHEWIWREIILVYMCVILYHCAIISARILIWEKVLKDRPIYNTVSTVCLALRTSLPLEYYTCTSEKFRKWFMKWHCFETCLWTWIEWNGMKQLVPVSVFTKVHNEHYAYDWGCLQDCDLLFFMFRLSEMRDIV